MTTVDGMPCRVARDSEGYYMVSADGQPGLRVRENEDGSFTTRPLASRFGVTPDTYRSPRRQSPPK